MPPPDRAGPDFSAAELERYSRNILLDQVGLAGQARLGRARVLVVGAGGLGCPALLYLVAAGVGQITLLDHDRVDRTNLQRQILFGSGDIGQPKALVATEKLRALNPHVHLAPYVGTVAPENALEYVEGHDLVLETSDNFATKFLLNDAAILAGVPLVMAGILRFEGQLLAVQPRASACYRCLFRSPPPPESVPSCSEAGVLGAVAGTLGSLQAAAALRILLGIGDPGFGRLLRVDLLNGEFRNVNIPRRDDCTTCGAAARTTLAGDYGPMPTCNIH